MKADLKGARRLIRCFLLVACAGCAFFADTTWTTSISFENVSSANWFSHEAQNNSAKERIVSEPPPEINSSTSQPSLAPGKDFAISQPASAKTFVPPLREITLAWMTEKAESSTVPSNTGYSRPPYTSAGLASLAQSGDFAITHATAAVSGINAPTQVLAPAATDPTWIGPNFGFWNTASNWSPAIVPNGAGFIADFQPSAAGTQMVTAQNVNPGVTLGTLSLAGTGARSWLIILTGSMTMDNNGNGAVISNVNTATGSYQLTLGNGSLVLADDLSVTNTSGSTSNPIILNSVISGTGNITFSNVSNDVDASIKLNPSGTSTFLGTSTIASGAVAFTDPSAFGAPGNQIILGSSGGGPASLVMTGQNSLAREASPRLGRAGSCSITAILSRAPRTLMRDCSS